MGKNWEQMMSDALDEYRSWHPFTADPLDRLIHHLSGATASDEDRALYTTSNVDPENAWTGVTFGDLRKIAGELVAAREQIGLQGRDIHRGVEPVDMSPKAIRERVRAEYARVAAIDAARERFAVGTVVRFVSDVIHYTVVGEYESRQGPAFKLEPVNGGPPKFVTLEHGATRLIRIEPS